MLTIIQIILLVLILFFVSRVILRAKEKVIPVKTALFWLLIWSGAIIGVLDPLTTTQIAKIFGVGRGVDFIVYISLALLFYLVFRIYVMIEDLRHDITSLVRQIALQNASRAVEGTPAKKSGK